MKKILFVINSLTIGGSEKSLISLLNLLDYKKYEVDLLMFRRGGEFERYIPKSVNILDELEYYSMLAGNRMGINLFNRIKYKLYRIRTSVKLRANLMSKKPIHAEQVLYKSHGKVLEKINKKYDVAIAYSQGLPTYYVSEKINSEKKIAWINCDYMTTMYDKKYDEMFYKKFCKIIAVSKNVRDSIAKFNREYEEKLEIIFDIIDPNLIKNMASEEVVLQDKSYINILTVARLVIDHKGYDLAVGAAKLLKDNGYKFKWFVVGDGPDKNKIDNLVIESGLEDNFILLGKKDNPYSYMNNCDIYVQPSKKEGFGLTVVEAKVLRKPIVCTNFNTAKELINDQIDGTIVNQDKDDIFKGIKKCIDDKSYIERIYKNLNDNPVYSSVSEIEKIESMIK